MIDSKPLPNRKSSLSISVSPFFDLMNRIFYRFPRTLLFLLLPLSLPFSLTGQDFSTYSEAQLLGELKKRMETSLVEAQPILIELIKLYPDEPAKREPYVFLAGLAFQEEFADEQDAAALTKAIEYYNQYLNDHPDGSRRDFVSFNLANAYSDQEDFENAIKFFDMTYRQSEKAIYRSESRNRMAALYIRSERAADGIPLFREVFSTATLDPELRAQAAAWLIQGYLAAGQPEEINNYLRYLAAPFEAVYDPSFNVTLLKSGDRLFEEENYDQAILLYSFVKSRDEIVGFYQDLLAEIRQRIRYTNPESDQFIAIDGRLKSAEARLEAVKEVREYDVDLKWRIARVYKQTDRIWESLWAFFHLYEDFPGHENVEEFLFTAYREADKVGDLVMAERLALDYLAEETFVKYHPVVITGLARLYADQRRYQDLMALVNPYMEAPRDFRVAAQMVNIVSGYYIVDSEFEAMRSFAETYRERFPNREPLFEATRYWANLSYLLLADYQRASEFMSQFLKDYDEASVYYEDVYYRYGVALTGEQKEDQALAQFLRFTDTYPDSNLRGEAELYIGDLQRSKGDLEKAVFHYGSVGDYTDNPMFIAKGVFSLAEVLEDMDQPQRAADELMAYAERYGEEAQLADAYYRIGMIFDRLGRLKDRFEIHTRAIDELASDASRYAVDDLISSYTNDYLSYKESFNDSLALLDRLMNESNFRRKFLTDRAYQFQFMQSEEGVNVERELAYKLTRDRAFRAKIIEPEPETDPATGETIEPTGDFVTEAEVLEELAALVEVYEAKARSLVGYEVDFFFSKLLDAATRSGDLTKQMRSQMALDRLSGDLSTPEFDKEQLALAPPAVILWEAKKRHDSNPTEAKELYHIIINQHPFADSVYNALLALGDITFEQALETGNAEDLNASFGYYERISERFAMRSDTAIAQLRKGRILSELGNDAEAIRVLGQILRNPTWKGLDHAKAHLELGRAYRRQGDLTKAHGFFERLIVAYGGFENEVAWAYYYDMLTLEDMNETESLDQLIAEYKTRVDVLSKTEAHALIEEKYEL